MLIGLVGTAGAGKDTAANHLVSTHGYSALALADPLKEMLRTLLDEANVDRCYADHRDLKEVGIGGLCGLSFRQLAQRLGTEWGRAISPDFWLRVLERRIDAADLWPIVITDVRFPNEAEWVRAHGGVVWRLTRPQAAPAHAHVSEQMPDQISADEEIDNSGSLLELHQQIDRLIEGAAP